MQIGDLWSSHDPIAWEKALANYWTFVKPQNLHLERSLDSLDLQRLHEMDAQAWYDFLREEYFRWKYTAPNRYATTTGQLQRYLDDDALDQLDVVRKRLLSLDTDDTRSSLHAALEMRGLGTAGASGLLSLMYPRQFATVDQFVVKALRQINGLREAPLLVRMNPEALTLDDGVLLIDILRRKAADNNSQFKRMDAKEAGHGAMDLWSVSNFGELCCAQRLRRSTMPRTKSSRTTRSA